MVGCTYKLSPGGMYTNEPGEQTVPNQKQE